MTDRLKRFRDLIRTATPDDLPVMARIHAHSGTPGLLTDLGEPFLRDTYYAGLLASPLGRARVLEVGGKVAGFVSFSPDSGPLFSAIFRRRLPAVGWALATATLRRPRVLKHFLESVRAVGTQETAGIKAEVVSLEVDPAYQGLGLGFILLEDAVRDLRATEPSGVQARILADHPAVERLYLQLGFRRAAPFRMHGRDWVVMVLDDAG